jgi:DNA-binding NarL/FixJ family response regulator
VPAISTNGPSRARAPTGASPLLTPREQEIAAMIGAGASNRDIAVRLKVGEGTVKAHLTSIFRKLGFADRLQLGLFLAGPVGRPPPLNALRRRTRGYPRL